MPGRAALEGAAYWAFGPDTLLFRPIGCGFPDSSVRTEVAGTLRYAKDFVLFEDDESYPRATYTFRCEKGAMQAVTHYLWHAETEERFAYQLTRPLNRQSFVNLFADQALGAEAYAEIFATGRTALGHSRSVQLGDSRWHLKDDRGSLLVQVTLVGHGKDYRISAWSVGE